MPSEFHRPYPWKRAVIIGASSGIGESVARMLASHGVSVALVARRVDRLQAICADLSAMGEGRVAQAYAHDVQDWRDAPELFQRIAADLGGVDLVVYASGIMPAVRAHEYPTVSDIQIIDTNVSGAVAWLNEAAHRFDVMGEGTIIGVSSVAGDRGRTGSPVYNASKAALDTYLEGLRARLARRGVTVLTAKPGFTRTPLIEGLKMPLLPVASPDDVAQDILSAACRGKRVLYTPGWWRLVMFVIRAIPGPIFERLSI